MTTNVETSAEWTFVFTDIEESTKQGLKLSPAEYARVVEEHKTRLRACFAQYGGDVEKNPGDGFFVAFPNVSNALACAVAIQQNLRGDTSAPIQAEIGGRAWTIQVRIGVYKAAGEVHRQPDGAFTDTEVNLANRFASCGIGGQILVNAPAYRAIARRELPYQWQAWDNRYIRDFDGPQILHELLWDGTSRDMKAPLWAPNWLLRETNAFVGRKAYLDNIEQWLKGDRPLLVLHGEGGVGKTRLVSQAVRKFGSGFEGRIYGVALDREFSGDPASVTALQLAARIGESLDAPQDVLSSETPDALARYMRKRFGRETCWLILDNFESVQNEQTLELIGKLLYAVPDLRCVVTCRVFVELNPITNAIEVEGMKVPPSHGTYLETYDGYSLFRTRAEQVNANVDLSDTSALVRILNATEGNALAIELISAHCKNPRLSLGIIADGLEKSRLKWLSLTQGSVRYGESRHKSLEACINWSFQLLPPEERELYPRLSVFPADFDTQAAETIAGVPTDILDHWIMFHLVQVENTSNRCILPPVMREFAVKHLSGEQEEPLYTCFAVYYSTVAKQNQNLNNPVQRNALYAELHNLHAAAEYLCAQVSHNNEVASDLYQLGNALWRLPIGVRWKNLQQAIASYKAALHMYTEANYSQQWAATQHNLGAAYSDLPTGDRNANLQQAIACFTAALRVRTKIDFAQDWAATLHNLGKAYSHLPTGDSNANLQQAITCYEDALSVRTQAEALQEWAETQNNLGAAYFNLSTGDCGVNLHKAITYYKSALRVYNQFNSPRKWAIIQNNLGEAYSNLHSGDRDANLQRAIQCFEEVLGVCSEVDFPQEWAETQFNMALTYVALGEKNGARQAMQNAIQGFRKVGMEQEAQKAEAMLQRTE